MTVTFDNSILLTSISPSDLTIDGIPATGVTVVNNNTLASRCRPRRRGAQRQHQRAWIDIHGVTMTPDNFSF